MKTNSKNNNAADFDYYFQDFEVKSSFKKEFISLWSGWLGKENYHKLDEVKDSEWNKFNEFIRNISKIYELQYVDFENRKISKINDIEETLSTYEISMNKNSSEFSTYLIPELECILAEHWDYTFILWYKKKHIIWKLKPIIEKYELHHFSV